MTTNPGGPGWRGVYEKLRSEHRTPVETPINLPRGILCMLLGCAAVYGVLFGTGFWLYGQLLPATVLGVIAVVTTMAMVRLKFND